MSRKLRRAFCLAMGCACIMLSVLLCIAVAAVAMIMYQAVGSKNAKPEQQQAAGQAIKIFLCFCHRGLIIGK